VVIKAITSKLIVDWRDPRQGQAALTPTDNRPPDGNVYCYRAGGELYVVVPSSKWKSLREQGKLDAFLSTRRNGASAVKVSE